MFEPGPHFFRIPGGPGALFLFGWPHLFFGLGGWLGGSVGSFAAVFSIAVCVFWSCVVLSVVCVSEVPLTGDWLSAFGTQDRFLIVYAVLVVLSFLAVFGVVSALPCVTSVLFGFAGMVWALGCGCKFWASWYVADT